MKLCSKTGMCGLLQEWTGPFQRPIRMGEKDTIGGFARFEPTEAG